MAALETMTGRPSAARVADLAGAALLGASALAHLLFPARFVEAVVNYRLLPFEYASVLAGWLPMLQLALAAALAQRPLEQGARLGVGLLGAVFLAAQGSAAARGLEISCGCFRGPESGAINFASAAPAAGLAAAGFLAWWLGRAKRGATP